MAAFPQTQTDDEDEQDDKQTPTMYAFTEDQLFDLVLDVAAASYHAGQYRGQFRGDALEPAQEKVVQRSMEQWWEINKENYK